MDVGAVYNNSSDIQSYLLSGISVADRSTNGNDKTSATAEYAKKGEPMYMAEMDSDDDGVVSLDEFRDYCKSKNISAKKMIQMSQLASSFRTMKAENETIDYISKLTPNVHPNLKQQTNTESVYAKQGEGKYNISMDTNHDKIVTYKEYMSYCQQNAKPQALKTNTTAQETDNGALKITNSGKALESYGTKEGNSLKSTFEEVV